MVMSRSSSSLEALLFLAGLPERRRAALRQANLINPKADRGNPSYLIEVYESGLYNILQLLGDINSAG